EAGAEDEPDLRGGPDLVAHRLRRRLHLVIRDRRDHRITSRMREPRGGGPAAAISIARSISAPASATRGSPAGSEWCSTVSGAAPGSIASPRYASITMPAAGSITSSLVRRPAPRTNAAIPSASLSIATIVPGDSVISSRVLAFGSTLPGESHTRGSPPCAFTIA